MPNQWVSTKITTAQASVTFRLLVGGRKPGTRPKKFEPRMKNAQVPIHGRK